MRKPTFWFPNWSDTNQAVQLQKMARALKFRIYEVTAKLICVFVFADAKCWFSHDTAQIRFSPNVVVRKFVFGVSDQVRHKSVCTVRGLTYRIEYKVDVLYYQYHGVQNMMISVDNFFVFLRLLFFALLLLFMP